MCWCWRCSLEVAACFTECFSHDCDSSSSRHSLCESPSLLSTCGWLPRTPFLPNPKQPPFRWLRQPFTCSLCIWGGQALLCAVRDRECELPRMVQGFTGLLGDSPSSCVVKVSNGLCLLNGVWPHGMRTECRGCSSPPWYLVW